MIYYRKEWYPNYFLCYIIFCTFEYVFFSFFTCKQERSKQCYSYTSCHNSYHPTVQENLGSDVAALPRQEQNPIRRQSIQWKAFSLPLTPTRALLCLRCASSCLLLLIMSYPYCAIANRRRRQKHLPPLCSICFGKKVNRCSERRKLISGKIISGFASQTSKIMEIFTH